MGSDVGSQQNKEKKMKSFQVKQKTIKQSPNPSFDDQSASKISSLKLPDISLSTNNSSWNIGNIKQRKQNKQISQFGIKLPKKKVAFSQGQQIIKAYPSLGKSKTSRQQVQNIFVSPGNSLKNSNSNWARQQSQKRMKQMKQSKEKYNPNFNSRRNQEQYETVTGTIYKIKHYNDSRFQQKQKTQKNTPSQNTISKQGQQKQTLENSLTKKSKKRQIKPIHRINQITFKGLSRQQLKKVTQQPNSKKVGDNSVNRNFNRGLLAQSYGNLEKSSFMKNFFNY